MCVCNNLSIKIPEEINEIKKKKRRKNPSIYENCLNKREREREKSIAFVILKLNNQTTE